MKMKKPYPNEPYRCTCPDCGSHMVYKLGSPENHNKTFSCGGVGVSEAREYRSKKYKCQSCMERKNRVYDKKVKALLQP